MFYVKKDSSVCFHITCLRVFLTELFEKLKKMLFLLLYCSVLILSFFLNHDNNKDVIKLRKKKNFDGNIVDDP